MVISSFLDLIPIWAVYPLTFLWALLSFEIGYRYGLWQQKKTQRKFNYDAVNTMVSASMALLAFLLAFVVNMATGRFDNRRYLVMEEATAIQTAYLQAGNFQEPYVSDIRALLLEYVNIRVSGATGADIDKVAADSEKILHQLWTTVEVFVQETPDRNSISNFISAVSEVLNLHSRRANAIYTSRLPPPLILTLYLVAALSMMMVGYQNSHAQKHNYFTILVMITIFTIVMLLIIDLDRSQEGLLRVSQQAMLDLKRTMESFLP